MQPCLLKKCHVEYERGERWFTGPDDEENERHGFATRPERLLLIVKPYARFNLKEIMSNIPYEVRLEAFRQLLEGVNALHSAEPIGFIHRDLKPANMGVVNLSQSKIEIVILDYGQTVHAISCNPADGSAGSPAYRAPEMENQIYGAAVDIWACGVIGR